MSFHLSPVGFVEKKENKPVRLKINSEFWDATIQIEKFSHLHVIWWADGLDDDTNRSHLKDVPPFEDAEMSGVFASRSPARPNLLCLSIVKLEKVDAESRALFVDQISANDGTPILDIKPYLPSSDRVDETRVPEWFRNLEKRYTK
ncbi:MAG: TrmO family methyltransferase domain-containing protein [Candidatus Thorarchaeota archaeon]|jgi:tRNA-Thr(GGU) m(6)t(6)A37 methyltransferase TsaA